MASANIAVAYSKLTGRIRWVLLPDDDSELDGIASRNPGEAITVWDRSLYNDVAVMQLVLNEQLGISPTNDRYCVVNRADGRVENIVIADPRGCMDEVEGFHLIPHPRADATWRFNYTTGMFER